METVTCPYCGENSTLDPEEGEFVLDCPVCCRPWQVTVRRRPDGSLEIQVSPEDS